MKRILLIFLVILPCMVVGITRTVALNGSQQFTSIQTAVNACSNGDSVLVYPGRYIENIDMNQHNITLASLYARNPLQEYMDSTIVDGNLNTCIQAMHGETVTINGFTLVNNEQHSDTYSNIAGGIRSENSHYNHSYLTVLNTIIRDCTAINAGGICIGLNASLYMSNVSIFNNRADISGGGLGFYYGEDLTFDTLHPCSIYNNFASEGMDIVLYFVSPSTSNYTINLLQGSLALNEVDNYYVMVENVQATVNIQQGYLNQIDQDLYVSPEGDDSNTGLNANSPLKNIALAMQKITSNADNPHTIHLAAGTFLANQQMLPCALKSHITIRGSGTDSTIIDSEMGKSFFRSFYCIDIGMNAFRMKNSRYLYEGPVEFKYCTNVNLQNLDFINNQGIQNTGLVIENSDNVRIENVSVHNITSLDSLSPLYVWYSNHVYIDNFIQSNCIITDPESNLLGPYFDGSDITIRNSIFANNTAIDAWLFFFQVTLDEHSTRNLDMNNVLFYNNTISQPSWINSPIYTQHRYQPVHINNCTFANNFGTGFLTQLYGYADVKNLISYNPGFDGEMFLRNNLSDEGIQANVNISNSLFRTGSVDSNLPNLVTFTDDIFNGEPLFLGQTVDTLSIRNPDYYRLSADSPCIDTGVADTTGMNLPLMDLAGNQRIWNGRIDMGCYEFGAPPVSNDNPTYPILPNEIQLSTYPNPVYLNSSKGAYTFIEFTLPNKAKQKPIVEIYNLKGQKVRTIEVSDSYYSLIHRAGLDKQVKQNGEFYSTVWDCRNDNNKALTAGIYLCKVSVDGRSAVKKLTILK